jgi:transcriptional regulator GlxA family with amidase domain
MKKPGKLNVQDVKLIHEVANIIQKNIERELTIRELARIVILTEKKIQDTI